MSIEVNFGTLMTDVFSTNSDFSYIYLKYKSEKVHRLFGLGWKNQEHTVLWNVYLLQVLGKGIQTYFGNIALDMNKHSNTKEKTNFLIYI